ncbi:MAG TPA: hypothetical protein DCP90_03050 [Clostridiales bacterium]|nr:MAG: hypothetical protein A2Y22_07475 [Clostridiales bacterium GWD2_32_59]HAN09572.1 hypothetical protein [Clostridiales bacterium]
MPKDINSREQKKQHVNKNLEEAVKFMREQMPLVDGLNTVEPVLPRLILDKIKEMTIVWSYLWSDICIKTKLLGNYKIILQVKETIIAEANVTLSETSTVSMQRVDRDSGVEKYIIKFSRKDFEIQLILKSRDMDKGRWLYSVIVECVIDGTRYIDYAGKYGDIFKIEVKS